MPGQATELLLIALLPLLAAMGGLLLRRLPPLLHALLGAGSLAGSAVLAVIVNSRFSEESSRAVWSVPWINGWETSTRSMPPIPLALQVDYTQILFILTTCLIGIGVLLYAIRERRDDPFAGIFHALLTFFCGSMLLFLVSDTLLLMYIAWELMGLAGYLLIRHKGTPEANRAARQAFWTTRATDFGLLFAIFIFMFGFGKYGVHMVQLSQISIGWLSRNVPDMLYAVNWMLVASILVLLAVVGKAALLPLSFWLPDAMVAPAPVSALLHSATLVAAGPLLVSRLMFGVTLLPIDSRGQDVNWFISPLIIALFVGGLTMLVGAVCAACQRQPKRLLAWSTVSQLGLCILGSAALASEAARFQLLSHAWFKAALFLAVGIIVARWHERRAAQAGDSAHAEPEFAQLQAEPDAQPLLYWLGLLPAALSLAGIVGLAGYFGKDQILAALLQRSGQEYGNKLFVDALPGMPGYWQAGAWMLLFSIPFTAVYCGRLLAGLRASRSAPPVQPTAGPEAPAATGWNLATTVTVILSLVGSIGLAIFWSGYRQYFEGRSNQLAWGADFDLLTTGLALLLILVGGAAGVLSMSPRGLAAPTPLLTGLATVFREGLYLKQIITGFVAGFGEFLAILAGIADIRLIDWLGMRCGSTGRALAGTAAWLDIHFVDGIRWWSCEIWWIMKRVHGRYWQNGQIQNYMFILLLGAVLLCLVVAFPLNEALGRILGRYN